MPRAAPVVGLCPLPALQRPVGAVGRLAGANEPRERRPVVLQATAGEDALASVPEVERDLRHPLPRRPRVDRAGRDHLSRDAARTPADERLAAAVHAQRHVARVAVEQLRSRRFADRSGEGCGEGEEDETDPIHERHVRRQRHEALQSSRDGRESRGTLRPREHRDRAGAVGRRNAQSGCQLPGFR